MGGGRHALRVSEGRRPQPRTPISQRQDASPLEFAARGARGARLLPPEMPQDTQPARRGSRRAPLGSGWGTGARRPSAEQQAAGPERHGYRRSVPRALRRNRAQGRAGGEGADGGRGHRNDHRSPEWRRSGLSADASAHANAKANA
eukprot:3044301-Pyramimonas_sp.AAC.1